MTLATLTELFPYIVGGGATWRWWVERRDRRSDLMLAKTEAEKTVASQKVTIEEKNNEIRDLKDERDRLEDRVAHLESLLYSGGGRT